MSGVRHHIITAEEDGQRLDRWLKKFGGGLPFRLVQKLIRDGQVRIEGKRAKPDTRLVQGQNIRIPPLEDKKPDGSRTPKPKDVEFIRSLVIYDDGQVIALNKPHGVPTQGGTNQRFHIDGLLPGLANKDGIVPKLVHRLDRDTSGVLLLARNAAMARALGHAFKGRGVKKIYWALVSPVPGAHEGRIKAPIAKSSTRGEKEKMRVDEAGKIAITDYSVLEFAHDRAAFMAFWPRTGRTHQIRVHAQLLGAPIIGDPKYQRPDLEEHLKTDLHGLHLAPRLHLHARRVILPHPAGHGVLDITAPLPPDLQFSWKALGFSVSLKGDPFEDSDV